jgi:hypothetical protein
MSDQYEELEDRGYGESLSWSEVWIRALTRPSVETYESFMRDPKASANRAYGWVFVSALVGTFITFLIGFVITSLGSDAATDLSPVGYFGSFTLLTLCCVPIIAVLSVIGLAISAGLTQLVARAFGGTGTYTELVYAIAAFTAPLSLIASVISPIPCIGFLAIVLGIYGIALGITAVNAAHGFGWGKATVSYLVVPVGIAVIIACFAIGILALLGPQIGDVFSQIIEELSTPTP